MNAESAYWLGAIDACRRRGVKPADLFKAAQFPGSARDLAPFPDRGNGEANDMTSTKPDSGLLQTFGFPKDVINKVGPSHSKSLKVPPRTEGQSQLWQ